MSKSFKDIYEEDKKIPKGQAIKPEDIVVEEVIVKAVTVDDPTPKVERKMTVLEEQFVRVDLTESIKDILTEQREQTAKVLGSVVKSNTKIANNVAKHVKETAETNVKLVEAIISLTDKIELLEAKLDAIKDLEIPTPIVQVNAPNKKINKEIHRDKKGIITHITESEVNDDGDE